MRFAFISLILLLAISPALPAGPAMTAQVAPQVWADTADGGTADFLVILRAQANTAALVSTPLSAAQRSEQVYQTLRQAADSEQPALEADLQARQVQFRAYWIVNLLAVHGDQALVSYLASRPEVQYIESDAPFKVDLETPDPAQPITPAALPQPAAALTPIWNLNTVHAPDLWAQGFTGQGIVYANADTGVQWNHPALINQYRGWNGAAADHNYNWWDAIHASDHWGNLTNICGFDLQAPCDDYGHGTHTTGTGVGSGDGVNAIGVAPGARWIACRNMNGGVGRPSTYIECLQFFIAPTDLNGKNPDPSKHADVISNSYSCPPSEGCAPHSLAAAVQAVRAAGIFMSVSAGNDGSSCSTITDPPGLESAVFTVGNTDQSNTIAPSSSRGPVTIDGSNLLKPNLVAPGTQVYSSWSGSTYTTETGTSMSAPHVAGAVALLWSALRGLKNDVFATELLLEITATPLTSNQGCGGDSPTAVPNNVYGYGLLNTLAAYTIAMSKLEKVYLPVFYSK
jgi:subtilisin family serine protease